MTIMSNMGLKLKMKSINLYCLIQKKYTHIFWAIYNIVRKFLQNIFSTGKNVISSGISKLIMVLNENYLNIWVT